MEVPLTRLNLMFGNIKEKYHFGDMSIRRENNAETVLNSYVQTLLSLLIHFLLFANHRFTTESFPLPVEVSTLNFFSVSHQPSVPFLVTKLFSYHERYMCGLLQRT
jgi:hypothetical protein